MRRLGLVVTIGAAFISGVALAAPKIDGKISAAEFELESTESARATTKCPRGEHALSGGVVPYGSPEFLNTHASGPTVGVPGETDKGDKAKYWYVSQDNNGFGTHTFKVFAICSKRLDARIATRPQFDVDKGETISKTVTCPQGERVVGGGVIDADLVTQGRYNFLLASGPLDASGHVPKSGEEGRRWYVEVRSENGADQIFEAYAMCSADSKSTIEMKERSIEPGGFEQVLVKCDRKERLIGGGVLPSDLETSLLTVASSGPVDFTEGAPLTENGDSAKFWYAAVANYRLPNEASVKVFAICE